MCARCYGEERAATAPRCDTAGCDRASHLRAGGPCTWCQRKIDRWGSVKAAPGKGAPGRARRTRNEDGRRFTAKGYVLVRMPDDSWCLEHRAVMADHLRRNLYEDETVHHRNGNRADNALSNLELWVSRQPSGQRVEDVLAWAHEIVARYGDLAAA